MKETLLQVLTILYGLVGFVSVAAFWPTIVDLRQQKPSANTSSYLIWTLTSFVSFLYSIFILSDKLVLVIFGINFICCVFVFLLSVQLNQKRITGKRNIYLTKIRTRRKT